MTIVWRDHAAQYYFRYPDCLCFAFQRCQTVSIYKTDVEKSRKPRNRAFGVTAKLKKHKKYRVGSKYNPVIMMSHRLLLYLSVLWPQFPFISDVRLNFQIIVTEACVNTPLFLPTTGDATLSWKLLVAVVWWGFCQSLN